MKDNDPHIVFEELLGRYLAGELSSEEALRFDAALKQKPGLKDQLDEFRRVWDSMDGVTEQHGYDVDAEWSALSEKIPDFASAEESTGKVRSLLYYSYRIAAALLVGVLFAFAWIYATKIAGTRVLEAGMEPMEVMLEDGTQVILNRHSKIRYSKQFSTDSRKLILSGEAWFDVARDTARPFLIDAGSALVEVLGTSFNVNAYEENPTVEIVVESGVVAVSAKQDHEDQIILRAGNSGTYNSKSRELQVLTTFHPNKLSWKTRELYFEDSPLSEVAQLVGKVYNVKVHIPNKDLASCRITVRFNDQSLDAVLNVLERTLDLEITRSGDSITLNGEACID